uniref:Uncharacterized protein n=1 Tax=Acrobeloides nanus TaxID=290746 RepID=A0A914C7L0_9BILA
MGNNNTSYDATNEECKPDYYNARMESGHSLKNKCIEITNEAFRKYREDDDRLRKDIDGDRARYISTKLENQDPDGSTWSVIVTSDVNGIGKSGDDGRKIDVGSRLLLSSQRNINVLINGLIGPITYILGPIKRLLAIDPSCRN